MQEFTLYSHHDRLPLKGLLVCPETTPRAIVQVSHGMCEHKERYLPFLQFLAEHGFVCVIHDHRGHGGSVRQPEDLGYFYPDGGVALVSDLYQVSRWVRRKYPEKSIWCFTGFRLEDELLRDGSHPRCQVTDRLLSCIDVLVDGRFVAAEKDISLQFRGSRNQRVLDLPKTLAAGQPVIWEHLKK